MMKKLMGCCLNHEMALDCIKAKANSTEDELNELKAWQTGMEKKFAYTEHVRGELEKQMEFLRQILEDKEKEIADTKDRLRQGKEEAICEYRDSDALFSELGGPFAKGFEDSLREVKASYPDLDLSHVNIDTQAQPLVQPVHFESTKDLFADDDPQGDRESTKIKTVEGGAHQFDFAEEKVENTPRQQQSFFFFF